MTSGRHKDFECTNRRSRRAVNDWLSCPSGSILVRTAFIVAMQQATGASRLSSLSLLSCNLPSILSEIVSKSVFGNETFRIHHDTRMVHTILYEWSANIERYCEELCAACLPERSWWDVQGEDGRSWQQDRRAVQRERLHAESAICQSPFVGAFAFILLV